MCRDPAIPSPRIFHGVKVCSVCTDNHCKKNPVSVWLALVALDSLADAGPVPENRGKNPPKEVQAINKWLGEKPNSDILKDILEIAKNEKAVKKNIKDIKQNKNDVKGN